MNDRLAQLRAAGRTWEHEIDRLPAGARRSALRVACKVAALALEREVLPRFKGGAVVVPPRALAVKSEASSRLIRYEHDGVIVIECEPGCRDKGAAGDLVTFAQDRSVWTDGWAPIFTELVKSVCEAAPKFAGLEVVP